jgi:ribonuclease VapC
MIVVDTSALMAVVLGEPRADACASALVASDRLLISAVTVSEALIVAARRNVGAEMTDLIDGLGFEVLAVTDSSARLAAQAYARWGKGVHPAALNFGDCFAYAAARENGCPLLYVGEDFDRTDVERAL